MVLSISKEPKDQKNITDFLNLNRVSYQCFFTCLCVFPLSSAYIHSLELVVSLRFSKPLSPYPSMFVLGDTRKGLDTSE